MLGKTRLQRLQPPDGSANPVRECRAIQLDTVPRKDLALSVQWEVIAVFGNQNVGQQSGSGQAFGDRALRGRSLVDRPAGATAKTWSADTDNAQPRRHVVEHLADALADEVERTAAARAGLLLDVDPPVLTFQVWRQT